MSFVIEWITNIIIFLLLAVVIDLLLPSTNLQKYVKIVVGLILILIILSPLLKIFSVDVDRIVASIPMEGTGQKNMIENAIEKQKREIQASQRAYILEQMAVHMKKDIAEELMNKYGLTIEEIALKTNDEQNLQLPEDLQSIEITLKRDKSEDSSTVPAIKPVIIDTSTPLNQPKHEERLEKEIALFLAEKWGVSTEKIAVQVEGRKEK